MGEPKGGVIRCHRCGSTIADGYVVERLIGLRFRPLHRACAEAEDLPPRFIPPLATERTRFIRGDGVVMGVSHGAGDHATSPPHGPDGPKDEGSGRVDPGAI